MEAPKKIKITVDYSGSLVKTTKVMGWLFFVFGIIGDVSFFFATDDKEEVAAAAIIIFVACILWLLFFSVASKILEHLLFMRKISEQKAESEGYEIKRINDKY